MKLFLPVLWLSCFSNITAISQEDSSVLLKQAEIKLQNHSAVVSSILTDKTYVLLHPLTAFREMIRKYSSAGVVSITTDDEPGKKIKVIAAVKNKEGQPVADALVYLYQTDSRGWYAANAPHVLMNEGDFRHARLFGYLKTDKNGRFELHTIKPSGYPQSDLPAHIHVQVIAAGYQSYGTEFLFQDDERLKGEILNRAIIDGGMIAKPEPAETPFVQQFSYEIKLIRK
jgi:protocatechuate 3,4-dioxygenase beta subunit